jgi:Flp pilus assembly protein TadD
VTPASLIVGLLLLTAGAVTAVPQSVSAKSGETLAQVRELISTGDFKQAETSLRAYLIGDPRSGEARYMLAYALLRQNKPKDSLEEYTRAAALQMPSAEELRSVGQDYVLLGDYEDAGKWITRSVELSPADPEGWYSLGRLRYTEQRFADAADCFQKALRQAPESVKVQNNLGLAYEGLNRTDEAVAAYRRAIALQDAGPRDHASEQPLLNLAIVLIHRANAVEALPLLVRAEAIAPREPRVQEQLGQLYMQQGNFLEAEKHLEIATRIDSDKPNLHFLLGQAYRHLGRTQEAKAEFDTAARLSALSSAP